MLPTRRALLLSAAGIPLFSQEPTFRADVKVVNLLATVHDREGKLVKDIPKEEFLLQEDGRPQTIQYFSQDSQLPLTLGLLVDTSRSQQRVLEAERSASYVFLDRMLKDQDLAFVMHFDIKVELLQDFTNSREKLSAALDALAIPGRTSTLLYDAIREASEDHMRKQNGRKAFILLSDGGDIRSRNSIVTAIEFAQRADTLIYSIVFADHRFYPHPMMIAGQETYLAKGRAHMRRLAAETGGGYFVVSKAEPIVEIYRRIEEELRHQYSLGYVSDQPTGDNRYRKIRLSTTRKDLVVRTREGYYPA